MTTNRVKKSDKNKHEMMSTAGDEWLASHGPSNRMCKNNNRMYSCPPAVSNPRLQHK